MKDAGEEVALLHGSPELCCFAYHTDLSRADCIRPFPHFVLTCRYNNKESNTDWILSSRPEIHVLKSIICVYAWVST